MDKELAIGIDIGGTNTVIGLVDRNGNCIATNRFSTADYPDINGYVEELCDQIKNLYYSHSSEDFVKQVKGIGIGAPNGNHYRGTIEHAPNLTWKGVIPLAEMVVKKMNVPVQLTNDAKAAAIGEMIFGGAKGMKNFIEITIGTGLGSGVVANGELIYGNDGLAGELGHVNVVRNGRPCGCGRNGCLESYVSKRGIIETFNELMDKESKKSIEDITPKQIEELARREDKVAMKTYDETGRILGLFFADAVCFLEPEAIFIFGGIAQAGNLLLNPTKHYMETNIHHIYKGKVKILPSSLPGDTAAILGAAAMIWKMI
jgi:glucokinase